MMNAKLEVKIVGLVIIVLLLSSIMAGFLSTRFIKDDIENIVSKYSMMTMSYIKNVVEETMLDGNADVMRDLLNEKSKTEGVEYIKILDTSGREALPAVKETKTDDVIVVNQIRRNMAQTVIKEEDSIIFYTPLIKTKRCTGCHESQETLLGVMKVSISIKDAKEQIIHRNKFVVISLLMGSIIFGIILWLIFRQTVLNPVLKIENMTKKLSIGDLSLKDDIKTKDEMGRLSKNLIKAVKGLGNIINRATTVSKRVSSVTYEIEHESKKVADGAKLEQEAINNVLQAVERFNKSLGEIAEIIRDLSISAEHSATGVNEMRSSTAQISNNTIELSNAIDATSSAIQQMTANIKEVAAKSGELTVSTEEAVTAIAQINTSTKEIALNTAESAKLAEEITSDASKFGIAAVEKIADEMETIRATVQRTSEFIDHLSKRSEDIGKILNVIDEITDQTTLLALNAAILAAQAGEHGKGFTVVADEIKDLAEKTALSTKEIGDLIEAVQSEVRTVSSAMSEGLKTVDEGSKLTRDASSSFKKIMGRLKRSSELTMTIERAATEQAKGLGFVADSMESVKNKISRIAASSAEQSQGASQIVTSTEKISDITTQVKSAIIEQAREGKNLFEAAEDLSVKTQEIAATIKETKANSDNILYSIERIGALPGENRKIVSDMNTNIRKLMKDAEVLTAQLGSFRLSEETHDATTIKMGIIPLESPAEMFKRFLPLSRYLSEKLNKDIELKAEVDYDSTIRDIGEGVTGICYMTPSTYIKAREQYGVEVLVKALRAGKPYQRIAIIAKEDSSINNVSQLKGASFAFGDILSTASYIIPMSMLQEEGIALKDLDFYDFLGHHDDVARAVMQGDFDAGGVMESVAENFKSRGIKILKYSGNVPEFNICVNKDLDSNTKAEVKKALLALNNNNLDDKDVLQAISPLYTGFEDASFEDYEDIRRLMNKLSML
jgi:methyl-accepting chemotaxis protein